jgi:cytochrome d ubiquinol oxidase subunit I
MLSAYFILAANSWMQHPVGFTFNTVTHRAELTNFWHVLSQNTTLVVVFHTLTAAYLTGGAFIVGIAAYHLRRNRRLPVMRASLRLGLITLVIAGLLTAISGDRLGKVMFSQQPMKMAAAEALWKTEKPAPFSVFAYGDVEKGHNTVALEIPALLSFLAKDNFTASVPGINDVNRQSQQRYGPGDYRPNIPVAYWGFRWMIGFGLAAFAIGVVGLWLTRRTLWRAPGTQTDEDEPPGLWLTRKRALGPELTTWFWRLALLITVFPLIANSWGWIFTETARQPWVDYGLLRTADAVSPSASQGEVLTSMVVFTAIYALLAVIAVGLLVKYLKAGPPELTDSDLNPPRTIGGDKHGDRPMAVSY